MAKVMISLPDDLLEAVDRAADTSGETRSRYVRDALRAKLASTHPTPERRRQAIERLRDTFGRHPVAESPAEVIRRERAR